MSRTDALAAYEALPLPDTSEEHWRFTDLAGFDPEGFAGAASAEIETLLDLDVAGYATVTADGIEIAQAPEGVIFAPLPEDHERLYSLVGWAEKFAAHNAAMLKHGWVSQPAHRDVGFRFAPRAQRARRGARPGCRRVRLEEGQDADPERSQRPRRDLARDRRLLRRRLAASRLRHVPGAHRAGLHVRLRLQGRAPRSRDRRLARNDPRREGRAEDERVPGVPEPHAQPDDARGADPGPRDPRQRRPLHARGDSRPGRPRAALLSHGPRPAAERGRAAHRPRLLPGRARPDRARACARSGHRRARSPPPAGLEP